MISILLVFQLGYPVYWTCNEFCEGFTKLLDHLHIDRVGSSLFRIFTPPTELFMKSSLVNLRMFSSCRAYVCC